MNYKEIELAILNRQPFIHNGTFTGEIDYHRNRYNIYSYSTLLCQVDTFNGNILFWNNQKYSITTSKQQNLLKRVLDIKQD